MIHKGRIDWNDTVAEFIRIKVERPQVLAELVRRERECSEKWSCEKKIQEQRTVYERLSAGFRNEQQEFELSMTKKRYLQRSIAGLGTEVSRLRMDTGKLQGRESTFESPKTIKKISNQIKYDLQIESPQSIERSTLMAKYTSIKQSLRKELGNLVARRVELKERLADLKQKIQQQIEQPKLEERLETVEQEIIRLEWDLQQQRQLRAQMTEQKGRSQQQNLKSRKNRDIQQIKIDQIGKKLRDLGRQCKKVLNGDDSKSSKRYQQFIKKYRLYNQQQEYRLKNLYDSLQFQYDPHHSLLPSEHRLQKYEEAVIDIMKRFNNKAFNAAEYTQLERNCEEIVGYQQQLRGMETALTQEVQELKINLQRKSRELEREQARLSHRTL